MARWRVTPASVIEMLMPHDWTSGVPFVDCVAMKKMLERIAFSTVVVLAAACNKSGDGAAGASSSESTGGGGKGCPAGSTEAKDQGFCIKLPAGYKFEKMEGKTTSFVNATYDRIRIDYTADYTFKNTPDDFKSMTSNKTPTAQGVLLGGKGGWAILDDGTVATGSVRVNHPKGGMLSWGMSSDSKSKSVQTLIETAKTISFP